MSPVPQGPVAPLADDSWEWDETDMTITEPEPKPDLTHLLLDNFTSDEIPCDMSQTDDADGQVSEVVPNKSSEPISGLYRSETSQQLVPNSNNVYQVFSLHSVELFRQPEYCHTGFSSGTSAKQKQHVLLKSMSKDSSFSSMESLPEFLGGLTSTIENQNPKSTDSKNYVQSTSSRRSESESGIVSDTGDTDTTTTNSGIQGEEEDLGLEEEGDVQKMDTSVFMLGNDRTAGCHQRKGKTKDGTKEKGRRRDISRRSREDDKRRKHRKSGAETVEILIHGRGMVTMTDSDSDLDMKLMYVDMDTDEQIQGFEVHHSLLRQVQSPVISQASSLESILAPGVELFPSKDLLHRSSSLESGLVQCRSTDGDTGGSLASLGDQELCKTTKDGETGKQKKSSISTGEPSSGELSRRTLDLLKRLENIQSPLAAKMTRSVSDMTLRRSSPQQSRLPPSTSLGGSQLFGLAGFSRKGPPSLINESSATASLTELSSTEDSSLGSEDYATLSNQRQLLQDPSAVDNTDSSCHRRQCNGNSQRGSDDADGASLSLLVNVSCTSACTDEDEDDSDLLSSSTLTLTEEELGVRDGEDEEPPGLIVTSSTNEDDEDEDAVDIGGPYIPGLDYMKRELQTWIRSPRTSSSLTTEAALLDELQCGTNLLSSSTSSLQPKEQCNFMCRTAVRPADSVTNSSSSSKIPIRDEESRRNATRSYISQFVDDVENGNVDHSCLRSKDEDDELLREESSVFTKKGEPLRESLFTRTGESFPSVGCSTGRHSNPTAADLTSSPSCELLSFPTNRNSSLAEQLKGELPCQSPSVPLPGLSPVDPCGSHGAPQTGRPAAAVGSGRKAITIQEKFKFSSFVTEEAKREVIDKESSMPPKRRHSHSSCCGHLPSPGPLHPRSVNEGRKENVHNFVMEIIDMTSTALKNKENRPDELSLDQRSSADQGPAPASQIKDKVQNSFHISKRERDRQRE